MSDTFSPAATGPFGDVPDILKPNPPAAIPEAAGASDATASLSPFKEAQDIDSIIKNLVLDRPLKLFIPDRHKYPEYEFRIINSIPGEIAAAKNKGFVEVTDEKLVELFKDLVAGTDKNGQAIRPLLFARAVRVGDIERKRHRQMLKNIYAGMDPRNKELGGRYTENVVTGQDRSKGVFDGDGWRIRV